MPLRILLTNTGYPNYSVPMPFNDTGLHTLTLAQLRDAITETQRFIDADADTLPMPILARYRDVFSTLIEQLDDLRCAHCETEPVSVQMRDRALCSACAALFTECAACSRDVLVTETRGTEDGDVCQPCGEGR